MPRVFSPGANTESARFLKKTDSRTRFETKKFKVLFLKKLFLKRFSGFRDIIHPRLLQKLDFLSVFCCHEKATNRIRERFQKKYSKSNFHKNLFLNKIMYEWNLLLLTCFIVKTLIFWQIFVPMKMQQFGECAVLRFGIRDFFSRLGSSNLRYFRDFKTVPNEGSRSRNIQNFKIFRS